MKKVLLSMVAVATLAMTSCGSDPLCECMEAELDMRTQMKDAGDDEDKLKKIEESFKDQKETCRDLMKEKRKEMKDMEKDERKKKQEEFAESCAAVGKIKDL